VEFKQGAWLVTLVLAIALGTALNAFTFAILYESVFRTESAGISENAVQVLTGWGGGMIGIIGAFIGYRVGSSQNGTQTTETGAPHDDNTPTA